MLMDMRKEKISNLELVNSLDDGKIQTINSIKYHTQKIKVQYGISFKSQYKALALKNHPDVGGSVKAMQEINAEYDTLFARLKVERKEDKETHTHDENEEDKQACY